MFSRSSIPALSAIGGDEAPAEPSIDLGTLARLCYFSNGITRVLRGMPFRAAACTGALYHIELYAICGELPGLEAGVYHYDARENALRQVRRGDFRRALMSATGEEPSVAGAPLVVALTSTWWRNAWKYQARAYRHAFWDSGTLIANLLGVARGQGIPSRVVVGFADAELNALLDIDQEHEATICLVALGSGSTIPGAAPASMPLHLPTRALSAHEVDYPEIIAAHSASSLSSGAEAAAWRARAWSGHNRQVGRVAIRPAAAMPPPAVAAGDDSIEDVILRRGSSRRFSHAPITAEALQQMLRVATSPIASDVPDPTQAYLIVNAVDGLPSGTYVFDASTARLEPLQAGDFRRQAAYLDLGQELGGDAAVNVYWLANLDDLDDRGYRAAQLAAAIAGGRLYLASYALGLGATGLTFFDDDVTRFFSPHAAGKSVMFLLAVGHPLRRR